MNSKALQGLLHSFRLKTQLFYSEAPPLMPSATPELLRLIRNSLGGGSIL